MDVNFCEMAIILRWHPQPYTKFFSIDCNHLIAIIYNHILNIFEYINRTQSQVSICKRSIDVTIVVSMSYTSTTDRGRVLHHHQQQQQTESKQYLETTGGTTIPSKGNGKIRFCLQFAAFVFSHVGLGFLVLVYTVFGAFLFKHFEGKFHFISFLFCYFLFFFESIQFFFIPFLFPIIFLSHSHSLNVCEPLLFDY